MNATEIQELLRDAPLKLVAARIKRARVAADLSHDRLGERVGTSRQHLISLEKGRHRPRLSMIEKIAEATGREISWFLDPEVDPSPFPAEAA